MALKRPPWLTNWQIAERRKEKEKERNSFIFRENCQPMK
jgi:hypothetical protein